MRRGDLVTVALQGDQGKPRPALVVQADAFADLPGIMVLPITEGNPHQLLLSFSRQW